MATVINSNRALCSQSDINEGKLKDITGRIDSTGMAMVVIG